MYYLMSTKLYLLPPTLFPYKPTDHADITTLMIVPLLEVGCYHLIIAMIHKVLLYNKTQCKRWGYS